MICAYGPPTYARREPSGDRAKRPQKYPMGCIIASAESNTRLYRTTCFAGSGCIQPHIAAAVIRIAIGITAYVILSRPGLFLPSNIRPAIAGVIEGLFSASAESSADLDSSCVAFPTKGDRAASVIA